MKIILVSGARPNFMKIAPLVREFEKRRKSSKKGDIDYLLVHTGQHYDQEMMDIFFKDFRLPNPDINLEVGSGSHGEQTGKIMIGFEGICFKEKPDLVVVVGDVNSTVACTLVAQKIGIKTAHVEAGLRSLDRTMPEEINRICTDLIADYLFTTCRDANKNLEREGISKDKIFFVGNIMIDSLKHSQKSAERLKAYERFGLKKSQYALLTLHRPSNVDEKESLKNILSALNEISRHIPIIFPIHPRTQKFLNKYKLDMLVESNQSLIICNPLGYLEFLSLMMGAKFVLTDSGGIQEETTALSVPCLTLRNNTERPITVTQGTNKVIGSGRKRIVAESLKILRGKSKKTKRIPELWDGHTAKRIVDVLVEKNSGDTYRIKRF